MNQTNLRCSICAILWLMAQDVSLAAESPRIPQRTAAPATTSTNPAARSSFQERLRQIVNRASVEAPTQLESMEVSTGVLIKRSTEAGTVDVSPKVAVSGVAFTDPANNRTEYGVRVQLGSDNPSAGTGVAYLDKEDIVPLLRGIEEITRPGLAPAPMREIEAVYRSKGGLTIAVIPLGSQGGKLEALLECGRDRRSVARLSAEDLAKFKGLIENAQTALDAAQKPPQP